MYTVMHVGYPIAGRPIREDEWKKYSEHETESAAWKSVARATAHLDYGQWDDHYIVIGPDRNRCDRDLYYIKAGAARMLGSIKTAKKSAASRENGKLGGRPKKS